MIKLPEPVVGFPDRVNFEHTPDNNCDDCEKPPVAWVGWASEDDDEDDYYAYPACAFHVKHWAKQAETIKDDLFGFAVVWLTPPAPDTDAETWDD